MRVLRHQIEVFGLRIGGDSAVTPRPAKNSYGFFNRSRSECPDFFPTFVTNKSINTFYIDTMELKEPFSDYARGNGITCPTAADAVRFLKEYEERLYQELLP